MQLDLKNVRVTYTAKEIVLALGVIASGVSYVVKAEITSQKLQADVVDIRQQLAECKAQHLPGATAGSK